MLSRLLSTVALLAIALTVAPSAHAEEGLLRCPEATKRGECRLQWEFSDPTITSVWIQRLSAEHKTWIDVSKSAHRQDGSSNTVQGGDLYRAMGCRDVSRTACVSTNVVWTPIWISAASGIPETVRTKDGRVFLVSKKAELIDQVLQYNYYRLVLLAAEVGDFYGLPAMLKPGPAMETFEDTVQANVYGEYMALRVRQRDEG
jgi:hypothetical protein